MSLQSVFAYDGVGDERVRRHDAAQQQGCRLTVAYDVHAAPVGQSEGDEEREESEEENLHPVALHSLDVHLQSGEEHDVIQTHLAEQLERTVALQDIESVFAHHHSGENHPHDMWDTQLAHDYRSRENDEEHHEEYRRGVRNGQIIGQVCYHFYVYDA